MKFDAVRISTGMTAEECRRLVARMMKKGKIRPASATETEATETDSVPQAVVDPPESLLEGLSPAELRALQAAPADKLVFTHTGPVADHGFTGWILSGGRALVRGPGCFDTAAAAEDHMRRLYAAAQED